MTDKHPTDFIYGVDERHLREVLLFDTFEFQPIGDINHRQLENSICGCARNYLDKFSFVAPIVPYGILVRDRKGISTGSLLDDVSPHSGSNETYEVGVYKQKKGDKEILSIGISSDVLVHDVVSYYEGVVGGAVKQMPKIDMMGSASNSVWRELTRLVDADIPLSHESLTGLGFMRDGVKKPGYNGAAHLCVPFMVKVDHEAKISFNDENYEFMGWLSSHELITLISSQQMIKDLEKDSSVGFADFHFMVPTLEQRVRPLIPYSMEPWSRELFKEFEIDPSIQNALDDLSRGDIKLRNW